MERIVARLGNNVPQAAEVDDLINKLNAEPDDEELKIRANFSEGAIAFVHFDPGTTKSNMLEALIHKADLNKIHRGLYVRIHSLDNRFYQGRVVEGPFYDPDALKRDSTPVQFIVMNQGKGKVLSLPDYHGRMLVEILAEEVTGNAVGANRRPHPTSPIFAYDPGMREDMLSLKGSMVLGLLDNYDGVLVKLDSEDKNTLPRNLMTVGTVGSGKSNTNQVLIEETLAAGYAHIVIDVESEFTMMDEPSDATNIAATLSQYDRFPNGVRNLKVYKPPKTESKRADAKEFSVPFESLSPEAIAELSEMTDAQSMRFSFLYEQATAVLRAENYGVKNEKLEDFDISRGYPGMRLDKLIGILDEEFEHHEWKKNQTPSKKPASAKEARGKDGTDIQEESEVKEPQKYMHKYGLKPLIQDQHDITSYGALRKKLRELKMFNIFDRTDAPILDMRELCKPGQLSVIDMSDARNQQLINIFIADLLNRMFLYKTGLSEEKNHAHKVMITIEEAHKFVSRDKEGKMEQIMEQLRIIARRGRKRWLALHFVTQSPQHLPSELFELANNKIIHQTTGTENLRVLKAAAGNVNEGIWADVPSLGRGRALIITGQYPHPILARIRLASSKRNHTM